MAYSSESPRWHVVAAIAAWLVPGLGHWLLGQRRRAVVLCVSISFLWAGGFIIGGINIFDRNAHPIWFAGQMLIAPSILVEKWHVSLQGVDAMPARPDEAYIPYVPSYSHIHEQGVLYAALAGMLNLLAIMDVLYQDPAARARQAAKKRSRGGGLLSAAGVDGGEQGEAGAASGGDGRPA